MTEANSKGTPASEELPEHDAVGADAQSDQREKISWGVLATLGAVFVSIVVIALGDVGEYIQANDECLTEAQGIVQDILEHRRGLANVVLTVDVQDEECEELLDRIDGCCDGFAAVMGPKWQQQSDEWLLLAAGRIYANAERWKQIRDEFRLIQNTTIAIVLAMFGLAIIWVASAIGPGSDVVNKALKFGPEILNGIARTVRSAPALVLIGCAIIIVIVVFADLRHTAAAAKRDVEHRYLLKQLVSCEEGSAEGKEGGS